MKVAETAARTVDEAVARALDQLGLDNDQVDVEVIREGSRGFLGLGSEEAIVRVTAKEAAPPGGGSGRQGARRRGRRGGRGRRGEGRDRNDGGDRNGGDDSGNERQPSESREPVAVADRDDDRSEDDRSAGRRNDRGRRSSGGDRGGRGRGRGSNGSREGRRARGPTYEFTGNAEHTGIPGQPDELPAGPRTDSEDEVDLAGGTLRDILNLLGLSDTEISARDPETAGDGEGMNQLVFDIYGTDEDVSDDLGVLIGRRGETLRSLQYLLNVIVSEHAEGDHLFSVDIEGYKRRREQQIIDMALDIADEVRETGDVITLEAMPAAERRIIHLCLENEDGVVTESVGQGDDRAVEVLPA